MQFQAIVGDASFDLELDGESLTIDGRQTEFRVHRLDASILHLLIDGRSYVVSAEIIDVRTVRVTYGGVTREVRLKSSHDFLLERLGMDVEPESGPQELRAPMPGLVLQILVQPDQEVDAGDSLIVLEAMKMENELRAETPARVAIVHVQPGDAVGRNALLLTFEGS